MFCANSFRPKKKYFKLQKKKKKLKKSWTIVYWKHKFALGAHYESTVPGVAIAKKENENDDDEESDADE